MCHYRNDDTSSSDDYSSDVEKYGDGEFQSGYYMVNQDDVVQEESSKVGLEPGIVYWTVKINLWISVICTNIWCLKS